MRFSCVHVEVLSESRKLSGYLWRHRALVTSSLSPLPPFQRRRRLQFCIRESQYCFILSLVFEPLFLAQRHDKLPWWYTDWGKLCQVQHQRHRGPARWANEATVAVSSPFNSVHLSICTLLKWHRHPSGLPADGLPGLCPVRQQPPHSGPVCVHIHPPPNNTVTHRDTYKHTPTHGRGNTCLPSYLIVR